MPLSGKTLLARTQGFILRIARGCDGYLDMQTRRLVVMRLKTTSQIEVMN